MFRCRPSRWLVAFRSAPRRLFGVSTAQLLRRGRLRGRTGQHTGGGCRWWRIVSAVRGRWMGSRALSSEFRQHLPPLCAALVNPWALARGDGYGGAVVASSPEANTQQPTPPTPARLPSPMHRADERQRRGREGWRGRWTYRPRIEPFLHLHAPARYIRPADGLRSGATWLAPTCCQRTRASIPPEPCRPAS